MRTLKCRFCFVNIVFVNPERIMWWCHELDFVIIEHLYAKGQSDFIGYIGCSCNEMGHWACGVLDSFHWCQHEVGCCVWRVLIPSYEKNRWQRDFWRICKDGHWWWACEFHHSWENTAAIPVRGGRTWGQVWFSHSSIQLNFLMSAQFSLWPCFPPPVFVP